MELKPSFGEAMKVPRHRDGLPPQQSPQTIDETEAGNNQNLQETDTNVSHTQTVAKGPSSVDVRLPLNSLMTTKSEPTLMVRERRASSTGSANEQERHHSSAPSTPRSRQNSMDDPAAMEYVFFAEVESHQVECLFSSYQQLLETIQERIVEHQVLSAHEDIVVLSEEKKADAQTDHETSLWHANALSTRSLSSRHPPPSFSDSRFTPVHHPIDLHHSPDQHLHHQHVHFQPNQLFRSKSSISRPPSPPPLSPPQSSHIDHLLSQQQYHQLRYPQQGQDHKRLVPKMNQTVMRISSNKEIKVVNTLLNSTRDLLQALRSLSRVISRLQAHRDIRWTQDARKVE